KAVLCEPVPTPHLVQRQRHQQCPDVYRRRHLRVHIQRCGQQPEWCEHQKRGDGPADHVPADGTGAGQVVAHPLAVLVGKPAAEHIAEVLEWFGAVHSRSPSSAPAANAAKLTLVSTECRCSSSSRPTPSRSITAGGILRARLRSASPVLVSSTSVAR